MTITIPDDVIEKVVRGILENFPEASRGSALCCTNWGYDKWDFDFIEVENDDKLHHPTKAEWMNAFNLLFTDKWPKGLTQPIARSDWESWEDWLCQADADDFDAFAQLACLGAVIYG